MKILKSFASLSVAVLLCVSTSGCLKTRAQLRETPDETRAASPQPAQVQDVQPQGGAYAIDEIKTELTRLNGRIEDLERARRESGTEGASNKEDMKKFETRIVELEQAQAQLLESFKKMQETQVLNVDPVQAFEAGKKNFAASNFDAAIDSFNTYLKSPKGKHVEEATFLRAESYFALKQFKKAIVDYSKFPEKYNHSRRMAASLLRIGQSFDALGMKDDAKSFYQELVDKYPKSKEAKSVRPKIR